MDDARYVFNQTNRDRAITRRSARNRKGGSKSKACPMRTDHMTPAQLRKENGPIMTYDLNKPHTYKELRLWPEDIQREYLQRLDTLYSVRSYDLAEMLGVHSTTVRKWRSNLGVKAPHYTHPASDADLEAWLRFLTGEDEPDCMADEEPTSAPATDDPALPTPDMTEPEHKDADSSASYTVPALLVSGSLTIEGSLSESVKKLADLFDGLDSLARVTFTWEVE